METKLINRIFVSGLTSSAKGGMEHHNLGNFIIVAPLFQNLRDTFPDAIITTSLQMSDAFYKQYSLVGLHGKRFWMLSGYRTFVSSCIDFLRFILFTVTRIKGFLNSPLLAEIDSSDLYIDFSGDIYGDNASALSFLEVNFRLWLALCLRKPTAMLIGSPGPFASFWRQLVAKRILHRLTLITNREPLSTAMLAYIGIKGNNVLSTACPSVLFSGTKLDNLPKNVDYEKLICEPRPTVGLILCGWNMPLGPYNRWPREDWEYLPFMNLVNSIIESTNYRVCLMSHQNSTDANGVLKRGNDHRILLRLSELLGESYDGNRIFLLNGLYDAAQSKAIISTFDLLISGRIHGAVQGLSQEIPTLILDYGHEPRAHKLAGFARVYGFDDYVFAPDDTEGLISGFKRLATSRERLVADLRTRLPIIRAKALSNFSKLNELARVRRSS